MFIMSPINLGSQLESELRSAAIAKGISISDLLKKFIQNKEDEQDIKDAEHALIEKGAISLADLKTKYTL